MNGRKIIMNFSVPPSLDDLEVMADEALENLPEELEDFCDNISIQLEELPDETMEQELDLDDPYDLLVLFRSGKEVSPGVEKKSVDADDILILFRRPVLDLWCEAQEPLPLLIRQLIIEELGRNFDFSDDEIDEMTSRHYQGLL